MLLSEDRIDTAFYSYEPKSLDGLIHNDHLATPQKMTDGSGRLCGLWTSRISHFWLDHFLGDPHQDQWQEKIEMSK